MYYVYYYYVLFIPCINVLYVSLLYFVCFVYHMWYVRKCVQKCMFVYDVQHKKRVERSELCFLRAFEITKRINEILTSESTT